VLIGKQRHLGDFVAAADVAGIETNAVGSGFNRFQRQRVVEVDVSDHRDRRLLDDRLQRLDVLVPRDGYPNDVGARFGNFLDLLHGRRQVGRLGLGHGLDRYRGTATDRDPAYKYLSFGCHYLQGTGEGWAYRPAQASRTQPRSSLDTEGSRINLDGPGGSRRPRMRRVAVEMPRCTAPGSCLGRIPRSILASIS
jgi:hypothetical protein